MAVSATVPVVEEVTVETAQATTARATAASTESGKGLA